MRGEQNVLEKTGKVFDDGEYRWTAMDLKQAEFANPECTRAKNLLAENHEQLGNPAESRPWRPVYLQDIYELRNGVPDSVGLVTALPSLSARCRRRCCSTTSSYA